MELVNLIIGTPLGYLMYFCLLLVGNYGLAILLFTLLTRIILFPLSLLAQKNSIKMVKMMPALQDIQRRNAGNKALVAEEQKKLHKKEHYSTIIGILPLLIQIPIILGLIVVIYNPLTHLFHLDSTLIASFIELTMELTGMTPESMGAGQELFALQTIQHSPEAFAGISGSAESITAICALDTSFLGLDLMTVPAFFNPEIVMALASAVSALLLSLAQNRYNVLQANAGFLSRYGMMVFLVIFSGYFAFVLPASLGMYWTATNLISIPTLFLCNAIYSPKAYMTEEFKALQQKLSRAEKKKKRALDKELNKKSKADSRRFAKYSTRKEVVFYSEASGFYKYYRHLINKLLAQTNIVIHYLTSDPNDQVFALANERLHCYYLNDRMLISTLMRMDAYLVVMTTPDLETYHLKRSLVRKDTEYIYLDHGFGSINLMLREHALDHFDTIFCYGPSYVEEIREIEYAYQLPQKRLVKVGFELYSELKDKVEALGLKHEAASSKRPQVLLAPSWQPDNIMESCAEPLVRSLLDAGLKVVVRPHPEFIKRFPDKVRQLKESFASESSEDFVLQDDFSDNSTLYEADLVITDWSTIYLEFCYATERPALFINTPAKIANPEYQRIALEPLDLVLRRKIGVSLELSEVEQAGERALELIGVQEHYQALIAELFEGIFYEVNEGMQVGADYIALRLQEMQVK